MTKKEIAVHEIMENFNFRKVEDAMKALGWSWFWTSERSPNEFELRKLAQRLLFEAYEKKTNISTGGFEVTYNDEYLELKFIVESWAYEH